MSEEEKKIIDRINRSYDDNTQYVEASAKDWNYIVHSIRKLHKEIEEKTTIIMAGAEKVKQLEKEIEALEIIHNTYKEMIEENNYISKDKIKEKIEELESLSKNITMQPSIYNYEIDLLKELLEE